LNALAVGKRGHFTFLGWKKRTDFSAVSRAVLENSVGFATLSHSRWRV